MVSYQKWTSIAFQEARRQGMERSQENSQALISVVADIWRERKDDLATATESEASRIARDEIEVQ